MCFFLSWPIQASNDICFPIKPLFLGLCLGFFISSYFYFHSNFYQDETTANQFNCLRHSYNEQLLQQNNKFDLSPSLFLCPHNEILNKTLNLKKFLLTRASYCNQQSQFNCHSRTQTVFYAHQTQFQTQDFLGYWEISSSYISCLEESLDFGQIPEIFDLQINFIQATTTFSSQVLCTYNIHIFEVFKSPIYFDQLRQIPPIATTAATTTIRTISQICKVEIQGNLYNKDQEKSKKNKNGNYWLSSWLNFGKSISNIGPIQKKHCFDFQLLQTNLIPNIFNSNDFTFSLDDKFQKDSLQYCVAIKYQINLYDVQTQEKLNSEFNNWKKTHQCTSSLFQCVFQITAQFSPL